MNLTYSRLKELIGKYGFLGLARRIVSKPFRVLVNIWQKKFRNYNYVFRFNPESPRVPTPEGFTLQHFNRVEDIPAPILEKFMKAFGEESFIIDLIGVKHCGCVLWVGFLNGDPVCSRLSRKASRIPYWFINLEPDDVVFMRGYTVPAHRGKGLSSCLHQSMAYCFQLDKMNIYTDTSIYNEASIKTMNRAGYILQCKKKAIREPWPAEL